MRPLIRLLIALGSILWLLALCALIVWNVIWAPVFAGTPRAIASYVPNAPYRYEQDAAAYRDGFRGEHPFMTDVVDLLHPQHGAFAQDVGRPTDGQMLVSGGVVMDGQHPVQDGVVSVRFSHPRGAEAAAGVFVAVFGRVRDDAQPPGLHPYQTGYAFEWDMHDGRQRLWAGATLLTERAVPGDSQPHELALVMQGDTLSGKVDGVEVLRATDSRYLSGNIGFGGHGRPPIVFTRFELQRPGQAGFGLAAPVDVGAPFDITETFQKQSDAPPRNGVVMTYGSMDERMSSQPIYVSGGRSGGMMRHSLEGQSQLLMADHVYSLIDSKHAQWCAVTAETNVLQRTEHEGSYRPFGEDLAERSTIFVRAQSADEPWVGCYGLTYDRDKHNLTLFRSDATGPVRPDHWPPTRATAVKVLGQQPVPVGPAAIVMTLQAQGATITGWAQGQAPLVARDATYPQGYVGFGAREKETAIFDWVRLQGE